MAHLDSEPASPELKSKIVYDLLTRTDFADELVEKVMSEYRIGFTSAALVKKFRQRLSNMRDTETDTRRSALYHLAWGLLPSGDALYGVLAEFYYDWCETLGVSAEEVTKIIRRRVHI